MSFTHFQTIGITTPAGPVSKAVQLTGDAEDSFDLTIGAGLTDVLANVAFVRANVKSLYILSDTNVSLETNATDHSGGDIIALLANDPLEYRAGSYVPLSTFFPTADVTKMYFTNLTSGNATVKIRVLRDSTP